MICIGFSLHIAKEYHMNEYIAHHPNKLVAFGSPPQAASKKAQRAETQGPMTGTSLGKYGKYGKLSGGKYGMLYGECLDNLEIKLIANDLGTDSSSNHF